MNTNDAKVAGIITDALGLPFVLRPTDEILTYGITDDTVSVTLKIYSVRETAREIRYEKSGLRMMVWKLCYDPADEMPGYRLTPDECWWFRSFTVWDDPEDFTPFTERRFGHSLTPDEYTERREWEGMQYRVGTAKTPMDSAGRVTEGYSPMADYWNRK